MLQIRIAALNAASTAADESQDPLRSHKTQTKEAQVQTTQPAHWSNHVFLCGAEEVALFSLLQEAEAFALYHKALDLQKHDKFEESARAYHELLKTPLLKEVKYWASRKSTVVLDDVCNTVHLQEMDHFTPAFCVSGSALR